MPKPQYSGEHERARRAYLAEYQPGQPCARCGLPTWPPLELLDLDHATDEHGKRLVPARYLGLSHRSCNRSANAFNWRGRGTGATHLEQDARAARRELLAGRAEYDRVQREIAGEDPGRDW